MRRKSGTIVTHTAAESQRMETRGEAKTDWKAAAKKPLPSGRDPDDAMEETDEMTTELPRPGRQESRSNKMHAKRGGDN
jgi:hypothetical protein